MARKRKFLSLICAASMAASVFSGLIANVGAATEADILWSDTFDSQNVGIILDGTEGNALTESEWVKGLTFVTTNRNGDRGSYTDDAGNKVMNGSYYAVEENEDNKYLRLSFPVFGDFTGNGRWAHVDLGENGYPATTDKDVIMDFDVKLTDGMLKGVKCTDDTPNGSPVLRIGSFDVKSKTATAVEIGKKTLSIEDDWVHARIIVSDSAGAKLYIDGDEISSAANPSVKALNTIGLYSADPSTTGNATLDQILAVGDTTYADAANPTKTAIADIDNVIIYNEVAGVATGTTDAPGAQNQGPGKTPEPSTGPEVIPAAFDLKAPQSAEEDSIKAFNFNSNAVKQWIMSSDERDIEDIAGLNIHIGGRSTVTSTFASVEKNANGKVLKLQAGEYSHAGRAPRVGFVDSISEEFEAAFDDGKTLAMSFAVRLSAPKGYEDGAAPRLYFMKNADQAGESGTGAYNKIAAVLTTVEGEEIRRGDAESEIISAYITPDEWHYVTFVVTPTDKGATHRMFVDGSGKENQVMNCDYVATGEAATHMSGLPILSPQSKAAKINGEDVGPDYCVVTIDNMLVYYGDTDEPRYMCATASEPEDLDLPITAIIDASGNKVMASADSDNAIVAKLTQNEDNTFTLVTKVGLAAGNNDMGWTAAPGDKIIVLCGANSMTPAADPVTVGQ